LGALWIEIARKEVSEEVVGKKKGKGKRRERPRYWYMEQLTHILPSYHTDE